MQLLYQLKNFNRCEQIVLQINLHPLKAEECACFLKDSPSLGVSTFYPLLISLVKKAVYQFFKSPLK